MNSTYQAVPQHPVDPAGLSLADALLPSTQTVGSLNASGDAATSLTRGAGRFAWKHNASAAAFWHTFGFAVIPIVPNTKKPAVTWDKWLNRLTHAKIIAYWETHPNHELGAIVGDDVIVFDADSSKSLAALTAIEQQFGVTPSMVVSTEKGEHHYFKRAAGTVAKSDSHCTQKHPERLDVKTGRALIVLPPSGRRLVQKCDAKSVSDVAVIGQDMIDTVKLHNGRTSPLPLAQAPRPTVMPHGDGFPLLQALLRRLDADLGFDDWIHVGMALKNETGGSEGGYELYDTWSSTGKKKYRGPSETAAKWRSFQSDMKRGFTIATLFYLAKAAGHSREDIYADAESFDILEGEDDAD